MNKLFFAKYFRCLKRKHFCLLKPIRMQEFLYFCSIYAIYIILAAPLTVSQYRTWRKIHIVEKSKEDILFQNLITAFFSEVPSAWSHEWMSNASSWIKHVGACAPTLCPQVYRYLRTYNVWYDHSKLVFREKHERRERDGDWRYFITSSSFFIFVDEIIFIIGLLFFLLLYTMRIKINLELHQEARVF